MRWICTCALALACSFPTLTQAEPAHAPSPAPGAAKGVGGPLLTPDLRELATLPGFTGVQCDCAAPCGPRVWASGEYLLWWIKDGSLPIPLVTFGDAADENPPVQAAALGAPGTIVLYGPATLNYGATSGMRFTLGGWADDSRTFGIEGRGFLLERRATSFRAASGSGPADPVLGIPFFNTSPDVNGEDAVEGSFPGFATGAVLVSSTSRFWGAEVNGLFNAARRQNLTLDLIGGFRYLDLDEHFRLAGTSFVRADFGNANQFGIDDFGARNQFYGGQLGARVGWQSARLDVAAAAKVALGRSHQVLTIAGQNDIRNATGDFAPSRVVPGFIFSEPTNIGRYSRDAFAVVPEVEVKVGYRFTPNATAFAGYNFLYWSDVIRPAEQINRVVNGSQRGGFPLIGPADPTPPTLGNSTDFWAHGVSFGLELKY